MTEQTRYVLLNPGDVIQEGDEFCSRSNCEWQPSDLVLSGKTWNKGWLPFRRADLAPALGVAAMREAAAVTAGVCKAPMQDSWHDSVGLPHIGSQIATMIRALPLPTHADLLAEAMKLPEIAGLIAAAKEQAKLHRVLRPNGYAGEICDRDLRAALSAIAGGDA